VPFNGGALPEVGVVELLELFKVRERVELALVVDVMFSEWFSVVFWGLTAEAV